MKNETVGQRWVPRRVQGTNGESKPDVPFEDPKQGILGLSACGLAGGAGLKQAEAGGPGSKAKGPKRACFPGQAVSLVKVVRVEYDPYCFLVSNLSPCV